MRLVKTRERCECPVWQGGAKSNDVSQRVESAQDYNLHYWAALINLLNCTYLDNFSIRRMLELSGHWPVIRHLRPSIAT